MSDAGGRAGGLEKWGQSPHCNTSNSTPPSFPRTPVLREQPEGEWGVRWLGGGRGLGTPRGSQPLGSEKRYGTLSGGGRCRVGGKPTSPCSSPSWVFQFNPHRQWENITILFANETQRGPPAQLRLQPGLCPPDLRPHWAPSPKALSSLPPPLPEEEAAEEEEEEGEVLDSAGLELDAGVRPEAGWGRLSREAGWARAVRSDPKASAPVPLTASSLFPFSPLPFLGVVAPPTSQPCFPNPRLSPASSPAPEEPEPVAERGNCGCFASRERFRGPGGPPISSGT